MVGATVAGMSNANVNVAGGAGAGGDNAKLIIKGNQQVVVYAGGTQSAPGGGVAAAPVAGQPVPSTGTGMPPGGADQSVADLARRNIDRMMRAKAVAAEQERQLAAMGVDSKGNK